jgi:hypothetical protein
MPGASRLVAWAAGADISGGLAGKFGRKAQLRPRLLCARVRHVPQCLGHGLTDQPVSRLSSGQVPGAAPRSHRSAKKACADHWIKPVLPQHGHNVRHPGVEGPVRGL